MVMLEKLDDDGILELARRTDELGVLSVYVDADPRQDPQAAKIDLKNRFRELQHRLADGNDNAKVSEALERVWPQIEGLASARESGRSRVLFLGLGDGWEMELESQLLVNSRVVLDVDPFIHPLLELLDEGRPAGVVAISAETAQIDEWRLGTLQSVDRFDDDYVEAPHERTGQLGGGPRGQFNTPMREQRQDRDRDRMERFVEQTVQRATELAGERAWERIVVSAGDRWTEHAVESFPQHLRDGIVADSRVLGALDSSALLTEVTELLHEQHKRRESQLTAQVREAGQSGNGALGLSEVAAALNDGRVQHLVYDPEVRYTGSVTGEGALYADEEIPPGAETGTPDSRLNERLVERALASGARVSPVEGAAQGPLKESTGIGALLRW